MTTTTLVPWSCAGKPLLAMVCLLLVAAGELDLDRPVQYWRPEFRRLHPELTPRHLLTHTAGVDEKGSSPRASVPRAVHEWPPEPGARPGSRDGDIYSAWWNWRVLTAVIETITAMPAQSIISDNVLGPASMRDCFFIPPSGDANRKNIPRAASVMEFSPAAANSGHWLSAGSLGLEHHDASSRICGSLTDLVRFYRWLGSSIDSPAGPLPVRLAIEATTLQLPEDATHEIWNCGHGLGFSVGMKALGLGKHCSRRSFGGAGALAGSNVVVGLVEPDHGFALAVAVNRLGRPSAFGLRAIVAALYEEVIPGLARPRR